MQVVVHICRADMDGMRTLLTELLKNSTDGNGLMRSLGHGWASTMLENIDGYGCWCYFGDDHGRGKRLVILGFDSRWC